MGWRAIKEEDSNFVEIADYLDNNLFDYRAFISFPFDCDEDKEIVREEFRKRGWSFTEGAQAYKTCVHLEELVGSILFIRDFRKFFKSIQYSEFKDLSLVISRVFNLVDGELSSPGNISVVASIKNLRDLRFFLKEQGFKKTKASI